MKPFPPTHLGLSTTNLWGHGATSSIDAKPNKLVLNQWQVMWMCVQLLVIVDDARSLCFRILQFNSRPSCVAESHIVIGQNQQLQAFICKQ